MTSTRSRSGTGRRVEDGLTTATKRSLLAASRSLESLAERISAVESPLAVLALFEDAEYFTFERERFAALARTAMVVVGFVGEVPMLPPGIERIRLSEGYPLAGEWTVLVVSPAVSAGLVANDVCRVAAESSLERGRLFAPEMSTDPGWVADQVERIVAAAGTRLAPTVGSELVARARAAVDREIVLAEQIVRDELVAGWWRSIRSVSQVQRLEELAVTDPLTGAYNRRILPRYLDRLGPRAPDLAAIAFDFDGFKAINDTWGHAAGDVMLRLFVGLVRERVRSSDLVIRMGGDEWLVLVPGSGREAVVALARTIREAFAALTLPAPAEAALLRVSAGVGVYPARELDLEAVDAALYAAKRAGGDTVMTTWATA